MEHECNSSPLGPSLLSFPHALIRAFLTRHQRSWQGGFCPYLSSYTIGPTSWQKCTTTTYYVYSSLNISWRLGQKEWSDRYMSTPWLRSPSRQHRNITAPVQLYHAPEHVREAEDQELSACFFFILDSVY